MVTEIVSLSHSITNPNARLRCRMRTVVAERGQRCNFSLFGNVLPPFAIRVRAHNRVEVASHRDADQQLP